ncbi:Kv channel-interacting protein 1 [Eurytemora carolleeae]|uniref:Kv channel-interacting protein 1 n=1 Tax=Eurytemora carolleeae TaxID=1294199 RepID=UPI000C78C135|nr:Kv channel-interacting protein 1 [Eurytemora carolleeae]|eukprot:XP_023343602.1 Kv channel-interacting protein 1-like [Eurytemora affinis]
MSAYSHYVFSALDVQETGVITFQDFALGLSILVKGTQEDKLRWTFDLYDLNGDGVITKDEMEDIIASVYDLMGRPEKETKGVPEIDEFVTQRVNKVFQRMDLNGDGSVSFEEFLESCLEDDQVSGSLASCTNVVI